MKTVTTGDAAPPRLPNVAMIPETEPELVEDMSVQVVYRMANAAKLNPAAIAKSKRAAVLFAM